MLHILKSIIVFTIVIFVNIMMYEYVHNLCCSFALFGKLNMQLYVSYVIVTCLVFSIDTTPIT